MPTTKKPAGGRIKLEKAILTWPYLHRKQTYEGVETKFKGTFLMDKSDPVIGIIRSVCLEKIKEKGVKVKPENWCIKDGDEYDDEHYHGKFVLTAGSHTKPILLDQKGTIVSVDDGEFYPGVIVDALVSFWVNVKGSNRVVGELHLVRKVEDGERLVGPSNEQLIKEALGEDFDPSVYDEGSDAAQGLTDDDVPF